MDESSYFAAQARKSEAKVAWEYGRLLGMAGLGTVRDQRVLDAGCGAGPGLRFFSAQKNWVVGLDRSFYALQQAAAAVPPARLVQGDLRQGFPLVAESLDLVVLGDLIEHIVDGEALLRACWRILRPGGAVLVRTVNRWDLRRYWQGAAWSGVADPTHVRLYSPPELRQVLHCAGFAQVRVRTGIKPIVWLPVRWSIGLPWPPLVGNGLMGVGFKVDGGEERSG